MSQEQLHLPFGEPFDMKTERREYIEWKEIITINGEKFDLHDIYETLSSMRLENIRIINKKMADFLIKHEVVSSAGSRDIPASRGRRYEEFMKILGEKYDQEEPDVLIPLSDERLSHMMKGKNHD